MSKMTTNLIYYIRDMKLTFKNGSHIQITKSRDVSRLVGANPAILTTKVEEALYGGETKEETQANKQKWYNKLKGTNSYAAEVIRCAFPDTVRDLDTQDAKPE